MNRLDRGGHRDTSTLEALSTVTQKRKQNIVGYITMHNTHFKNYRNDVIKYRYYIYRYNFFR